MQEHTEEHKYKLRCLLGEEPRWQPAGRLIQQLAVGPWRGTAMLVSIKITRKAIYIATDRPLTADEQRTAQAFCDEFDAALTAGTRGTTAERTL